MSTSMHTLKVASVESQGQNIIVVDLVSLDNGPLADWTPGAHIDIKLPSGLVRQYSLCGDVEKKSFYQIAILRDDMGRGGSIEAHEIISPGTQLSCSEPRNHFPLKAADQYLFVAGGIGITPLLPMIDEVAKKGLPWKLVYGGRSLQSMAFLNRVNALSGGQVVLVSQETDGLIDLDSLSAQLVKGTQVYGCGPASLLDALEDSFASAGHAEAVNIERFSASAEQLAAVAASTAEAGRAFRVELVRSGKWLDVPADKSLKEVLEEAGAEVTFSCAEGVCGTCETRVLRGVPEHHDILLSAEDRAAGEYMMVCVGRCKTDELALDL